MNLMKHRHQNIALALMTLFIARIPAIGQSEKDPHRPACTSPQCKKIKSFLKSHYCGESPSGNGPDDGCEFRSPKKLATTVKVTANYDCDWNETEGKSKCQQHGQPPETVRNILVREMRKIGLPAKADRELHFTVWESSSPKWVLAAGNYESTRGLDLSLCQIIIVIEQAEKVHVLRKVQLQKTNVDVPNLTTWYPLDMADVNGDGQMEIIIGGDAYEDHWIEVVGLKNGSFETLFSGLGYYL
jgi:hypothetical protein